MLLGALLTLHALAGGHYDPMSVARASTAYATVADKAGDTFRARGSQAEAVANGLNQYEEGLDLLGARAPAAERSRHADLKKRFNREKAVLQAFAQTLLEDFDTEFSAAVERATPAGAEACRTMIPKGKALPGMPAPMQKNPDCTGDDHTQAVIAKVDADPALRRAVDEIAALEWPTITVPQKPQDPVGGPDRWIAIQPFMRGMIGGALKSIDRKDEEDRLFLGAALEQEEDAAKLKGLIADANTITERTGAARASAAEPLLKAIDGWNAKKAKKSMDVSLCANPAVFGGCLGDDVSDSLGQTIRQDKKVLRALP